MEALLLQCNGTSTVAAVTASAVPVSCMLWCAGNTATSRLSCYSSCGGDGSCCGSIVPTMLVVLLVQGTSTVAEVAPHAAEVWCLRSCGGRAAGKS